MEIQILAALITIFSGLAWLITSLLKIMQMYKKNEPEIKEKVKEGAIHIKEGAEKLKEKVEQKVTETKTPTKNDPTNTQS